MTLCQAIQINFPGPPLLLIMYTNIPNKELNVSSCKCTRMDSDKNNFSMLSMSTKPHAQNCQSFVTYFISYQIFDKWKTTVNSLYYTHLQTEQAN